MKSTLAHALRTIEEGACIQFRRLADSVTLRPYWRYLHLTQEEGGCWADVGVQTRGPTRVNLPIGCQTGDTVAHELMHAMGFYHEHVRNDRDRFIRVDYGNVLPEYRYAFDRQDNYDIGKYDQFSVTHYEKYAFARNDGKPTIYPQKSDIEPRNWGTGGCSQQDQTGKGCESYLSKGDKVKLQQVYGTC